MTAALTYSSQRLRDYAGAYRAAGCSCGDCWTCAARDLSARDADSAADLIDSLVVRATTAETALTKAKLDHEAMKGALYDEVAANLAFREAGGALPGEDMPTFCDRLLAELAELRARVAGVEVNAARYQWLRGGPLESPAHPCCYSGRNDGFWPIGGEELDAAIDSARTTTEARPDAG